MSVSIVSDMEDVQRAYERVAKEIDAIDATALAPMNVDAVSATSVVLGVADRIRGDRDRMAKLPEFDLANVDRLGDYAKAVWFLHLTNQAPPAPREADAMMREAAELRSKLLVWTVPLVAMGHLAEDAVARVREGSGHKDLPSDLIALVALYRSKWSAIGGIVGVTEADLQRAAELGPAVFLMVSRREHQLDKPGTEGSLRLRRAWTRLDHAYAQCRRALAFLRFEEGDAEEIAPNVRRNAGVRREPSAEAATATTTTPTGAATTTPTATGTGATPSNGGLGGGGTPFVTPGGR